MHVRLTGCITPTLRWPLRTTIPTHVTLIFCHYVLEQTEKRGVQCASSLILSSDLIPGIAVQNDAGRTLTLRTDDMKLWRSD